VFKTVGSTVLGGLWADFYSSMKTLGATGLGGLWAFSGRGTLLKQTCALEAQESARHISIAELL